MVFAAAKARHGVARLDRLALRCTRCATYLALELGLIAPSGNDVRAQVVQARDRRHREQQAGDRH